MNRIPPFHILLVAHCFFYFWKLNLKHTAGFYMSLSSFVVDFYYFALRLEPIKESSEIFGMEKSSNQETTM